jgi:dolichyl-diphosphooligosaccharide--protein glycosyltransferase
MRKTFRALKGSPLHALRRSVKIRHIAGSLFLIFMVFLPNVWTAWDAGVPFGEKKEVDVGVYDTLPDNIHVNNDLLGIDFWINFKPHEYDFDKRGNTTLYPRGTNTMYNKTNMNELKYFGAFGHGFPSDYWLAGMEWLSEQDNDVPIEDRPGFISWWDYGFWSIYLGEHPTAADNFQGSVGYAGSFISANEEEQAIPLLIIRILAGVYYLTQVKDLREDSLLDECKEILSKYVGDETTIEIFDAISSPARYKNEVVSDPGKYGHYSDDVSLPIITVAYLQEKIPEYIDEERRVSLLHELEEATDLSLRYFAIDSRLFPFGPQNTGIYYAPLKLSDHRINDFNEPYDFVQTFVYDWYTRNRSSIPCYINAI